MPCCASLDKRGCRRNSPHRLAKRFHGDSPWRRILCNVPGPMLSCRQHGDDEKQSICQSDVRTALPYHDKSTAIARRERLARQKHRAGASRGLQKHVTRKMQADARGRLAFLEMAGHCFADIGPQFVHAPALCGDAASLRCIPRSHEHARVLAWRDIEGEVRLMAHSLGLSTGILKTPIAGQPPQCLTARRE